MAYSKLAVPFFSQLRAVVSLWRLGKDAEKWGRTTRGDMGDAAVVRRRIRVSLGNFGSGSLEQQARSLDVPASALVQQAALYYLAVLGSERSSIRLPRFAREAPAGGEGVDMIVELEEADWGALEVEAVHQRVDVERLIEHATLLFLADIHSGRVALRMIEGDDV